ncbi:MAG TPA: anti-sigma factor, partial [Aestuariivirgaceae bacterium]|nr:anti-sigma factor [Aestuariivirgaceae bacterium]
GGTFVATLQAEGTGPAFVAVVDLDRRTVAIRRLGEPPPTGRSYELWAIGGGRAAPESLGLVDADVKMPAARLGDLQSARLADTVFAVTVEPKGGSPSGQPSGAPIYVGKLIPTQ